MKNLFQKYKHALWFSYALIYIPWFMYLEKHVTTDYHVIHMNIDDKIPFLSVFIIPYLLWFIYVASLLVYEFFTSADEFRKNCIFLFTGMTIFLIVSTIYPNGHHLRPVSFDDNSIFTQLVQALYRTDTSTNLFPSIHVYNSLGTHIALMRSKRLKDKKILHIFSFLLMCSICMATVFLKQHSMFDVITAFIMAAAIYPLVYKRETVAQTERKKIRLRKLD
ncbi:MAG: phosphatase PAP2 family protein [Lachnospiraceae bacterium]|nr:phosphatase PAP2 family protein [Lachnospiraceae bacterium]